MLNTRLTRNSEEATVAIASPAVTYKGPEGHATSERYASGEVAVVVFEAHITALEHEGFVVVGTEVRDLHAAFALLDDGEGRTTITLDGPAVTHVHLYAADPVATLDNLAGEVATTAPLGRFDPESAVSTVLPRFAIRALSAWPGMAGCERVGIEVIEPWTQSVLDAWFGSGWGPQLTHLWLATSATPAHGATSALEREIGLDFPRLQALACSEQSWLGRSTATFPVLDRLRLHAPAAPRHPTGRHVALLDRAWDTAPTLRHLSLWAPPFDALRRTATGSRTSTRWCSAPTGCPTRCAGASPGGPRSPSPLGIGTSGPKRTGRGPNRPVAPQSVRGEPRQIARQPQRPNRPRRRTPATRARPRPAADRTHAARPHPPTGAATPP